VVVESSAPEHVQRVNEAGNGGSAAFAQRTTPSLKALPHGPGGESDKPVKPPTRSSAVLVVPGKTLQRHDPQIASLHLLSVDLVPQSIGAYAKAGRRKGRAA